MIAHNQDGLELAEFARISPSYKGDVFTERFLYYRFDVHGNPREQATGYRVEGAKEIHIVEVCPYVKKEIEEYA